MYAAPAYWLYEMSQAALNPARAFADAGAAVLQEPGQSAGRIPPFGKTMAASMELFERSTRRYGKPEWNINSTLVGGERVPVHISHGLGAAVLPAPAFRARVRARAAPAAAAAADRRADVGPLCDAAARHGRRLPAQSRRLHHRMGRRAHGAAVGGPLRSRRLHRLPDLDAALARRRRARHGGVPAVGAGARRGRAHGGRERPLRAAFHGADGRPDRYARQSDRGQHAGRAARHRLVPPQRHHQGAVPAIRASCATSIRASCSSTAS